MKIYRSGSFLSLLFALMQSNQPCIMVAVDGSRMSHRAFDMACALRREGEFLVVYHVSDARKKGRLPSYFGPEHLEVEFTGKLLRARVPYPECAVVVEERLGSDAVSGMILARAKAENAATLVVGAFGRKGPTVWAVGSNTDYSLKRAKHLTLVTARPDSAMEQPQTFCVGHDGSARASAAVDYALNRARPGDRLVCIHIRSPAREARGFDPISGVRKSSERQVERSGVELASVDFVFLNRDHQQTIGQQIVRAAEGEQICATYLVVGRDGDASVKLAERLNMGTVCDFVAKKARTTTIVVA